MEVIPKTFIFQRLIHYMDEPVTVMDPFLVEKARKGFKCGPTNSIGVMILLTSRSCRPVI